MTYSKGPWIYDAESGEIHTKDRAGFWGPDHEPVVVATVEQLDGVDNGPLLAAAEEMYELIMLVADLSSQEWQERDGARKGATDNFGNRMWFISDSVMQEVKKNASKAGGDSMKHNPLGILTGYVYPWEIRREFDRFDCGSLDANECIAAGSTSKIYYGDGKCESAVTASRYFFGQAKKNPHLAGNSTAG